MISTPALLAFCALCLFGRLVWDAWRERQARRALMARWDVEIKKWADAGRRTHPTWDAESGYPKDCTAEGLGPRIEKRDADPARPLQAGDDPVLREIVRETQP